MSGLNWVLGCFNAEGAGTALMLLVSIFTLKIY